MSQPGAVRPNDGSAVVGAENPWPGLLAFGEADQRWFQGRRDEIAAMLQHVKLERLTVLYALSGLGKSSLLKAGLFPALRREGIFPVYIRLDYAAENLPLRRQVYDAIAQAGLAADIQTPPVNPAWTLWEYFHSDQCEFWNKQQRRVLPLLVIDQFEEIFTLGKGENRALDSESFLEELACLAEDSPPADVQHRWALNPDEKEDFTGEGEYKLLISLREDFLPELVDQDRRIGRTTQRRYRLHQMNGEGALLAVSQAKDLIDEAVATQVVRYVAGSERLGFGRGAALKDLSVEPALLSVVCRELNNRRRQRGERKISADLLEGNQEQVLQDFYLRSFDGLAPPVRVFVEERLITTGGRRDSVAEETALAAPEMSPQAVERLVERRLLRREHRRKEVWIELTHDLLTDVVRVSRQERRNRERDEKQRRESEESKAKARRSRRLAGAFAGLGLLGSALAVVAFYFAFDSNRQQKIAVAQRVVAEQQTLLARAETARAEENYRKEQAALLRVGEAMKIANANERTAIMQKAVAESAQRNEQAERKKAELARIQETEQRRIAESSTEVAKKTALERDAAARTALEEARQAIEARALEKKAREDEATQRKVNQLEAARLQIGEAVTKIDSGQSARALGHIARALSLDPNSVSARTLALDELIRGGWRPSSAGRSGAETFLHPPLKHPAGVTFAAFSPDHRTVATASKDNIVRLWEWESARLVAELKGHAGIVTTVAFSPDGRRIVSASFDKTARIWDVSSRSEALKLSHADVVKSASFSADGRRVVTASQDKTASLWDPASVERPLFSFKHEMTVNFAAISRDGRLLVTACEDGRARVWNPVSNSLLFELPHSAAVKSAFFSFDGGRIVTASADRTARMWNVTQRAPVGEIMRLNEPVYFAAFSDDGQRVATASRNNMARLWDQRGPISAAFIHKGFVMSATFSSDNRRLVTASDDGTAQVWEISYPFDNADDIVRLAEAISGVSGEDESTALSEPERQRRLSELKAKSSQSGANAQFLRWFFAHRQ